MFNEPDGGMNPNNPMSPDFDTKANDAADAMKQKNIKDYWHDRSMVSEALGEASFNNELMQLFIIANDYQAKLDAGQKIEYMDFASVSTMAMKILLKEINAYFEQVTEL
jgi:hypothetical protein